MSIDNTDLNSIGLIVSLDCGYKKAPVKGLSCCIFMLLFHGNLLLFLASSRSTEVFILYAIYPHGSAIRIAVDTARLKTIQANIVMVNAATKASL